MLGKSPEQEHEDNLLALVKRLMADKRAFSITLDDTAKVSGLSSGDRTKRFLSLTGDGECKKWVYQPGIGPVCVDPPS